MEFEQDEIDEIVTNTRIRDAFPPFPIPFIFDPFVGAKFRLIKESATFRDPVAH
jgi:hypothetical protein